MKNSVIIIFVFVAAISVFIAGCSRQIEAPGEKFQEVIDTGVLAVQSVPGEAQVYVNDQPKGQTPLTLYNFPVGAYSVAVKKEGYMDFEREANVKVGLTENINAELAPLRSGAAEAKPEEAQKEPYQTAQANKISLSSFAMYYDFEKRLFTEMRTGGSDIFSRKYKDYVDITALRPAAMTIVEKPLKDVTRTDCVGANNYIVQLHSGETSCVVTIEGNYFAVSGSWEKMPAELEFVQLS